MGKSNKEPDKSAPANSGKKRSSATVGESSKDGDGNRSKQTVSRSDIKCPVRYEVGTENAKRKKSVTSKKGGEGTTEIVANFQEGGLLMNMAVTEEEYQAFEESECSLFWVESAHEVSEDSEEEERMLEESYNNNATRTDRQ